VSKVNGHVINARAGRRSQPPSLISTIQPALHRCPASLIRYLSAPRPLADQVRLELLGEDHPAVADSYNSAGITAGLQKRFLEEEHFYRK
jgi:hypothetical protein